MTWTLNKRTRGQTKHINLANITDEINGGSIINHENDDDDTNGKG